MNKERELLRRVVENLDTHGDIFFGTFEEIRAYLAAEPEAEPEPVEFKFIPTGKELLRYHPDEDCIETKVEFAKYSAGSKFYPPKPAESEADHERNIAFDDEVCPVCGYYCNGKGGFGCIDKPVLTGLRKPPKPAESEAETIETLQAENFKLASGQCTEGGPWGDKGGTPYCKYAARKPMTKRLLTEMTDEELMELERLLVRSEAALRQTKPMTDFREYFEEMHSQLQEDYGDNVHIFEAGFKEGARWVQLDHSVFKHHGIGDADV